MTLGAVSFGSSLHDVSQCENDLFDLLCLHCWEDRKRDTSPIFGLGFRKIAWPVTEFSLIERMQVQRNKMHTGSDAALLQFFDELISADFQFFQVKPQKEKVP